MKPLIQLVKRDLEPVLILKMFDGETGWVNINDIELKDNTTYTDLGFQINHQIEILGQTLVHLTSVQ